MLALLLMTTSRQAQAQGLASLAAAASSNAMAVEKTPTCWVCLAMEGLPKMCAAGSGPGSAARCSAVFGGGSCSMSQTCAISAVQPVDPDGASQYVSRGREWGTLAGYREGAPDVERNCQGVVVARYQTPDAIAQVRNTTSSLTL
jgi:hypothetical protein